MIEIEVNNIEEECIYVVNKSVTNAGRGVVAPFYGSSSCRSLPLVRLMLHTTFGNGDCFC